ncbi:hypothetical protein HDU85_005795 [Gaertneriomyces sp. JEL0708]|nr:hypothetical protein HDU85_005795 [Gaertneriomyces sp. JEL0708]
MKVSALVTVAASVAALIPGAFGHGYVTSPATRGEKAYGRDNYRGFPVPDRPTCTSLPRRTPTNISPGPLKIKMSFIDGANHIGMCTAYLADANGGNRKKIGERKDCARSLHPGAGNKGDSPIPGEMTVNIPNGGCGQSQCMIFWHLRAVHLGEGSPEIYDDCMDVVISGSPSNGGGSNNGGGSSTPQPPAKPVNSAVPAKDGNVDPVSAAHNTRTVAPPTNTA